MFSHRLNSNMTTLRNSSLNSFRFRATAPLTDSEECMEVGREKGGNREGERGTVQ